MDLINILYYSLMLRVLPYDVLEHIPTDRLLTNFEVMNIPEIRDTSRFDIRQVLL
jgi:hypothetical protein